jgi:glycine dehydrogenase subunit 1
MRNVANLCLQKAHYAAQQFDAASSLSLAFTPPFFKEFVVRVKGQSVEELIETAQQENIFAGIPLGRWYPELADCMLVAVTEKRTKEEIDRLVEVCS